MEKEFIPLFEMQMVNAQIEIAASSRSYSTKHLQAF